MQFGRGGPQLERSLEAFDRFRGLTLRQQHDSEIGLHFGKTRIERQKLAIDLFRLGQASSLLVLERKLQGLIGGSHGIGKGVLGSTCLGDGRSLHIDRQPRFAATSAGSSAARR